MRTSALTYKAIRGILSGIFLIAYLAFAVTGFAQSPFRARVSGEAITALDGVGTGFSAGALLRISNPHLLEFSLKGTLTDYTLDNDSSLLYLSPELTCRYSYEIAHNIKRSSVFFGEAGLGYSIPLDDENDGGIFPVVHAGYSFKPLPIIDIEFFISARPMYPYGSSDDLASVGGGVGLVYQFGFKDQDGDWVPDWRDTCPDTPRGAIVDEYGCALDSDGDGVFDGIDKCPNTPWGCIVDEHGCPIDSDGDGVCDGLDLCPDTPSHIKVDSTGCPLDSDGDGVPDYRDNCPGTPLGCIVDEHGCPMDSDGDGVCDGLDECPQTPTGFVVDARGCPLVAPVERDEIRDAYDASMNIRANAMQRLDNIAERLRAYPYRVVEIGVYTDSEGSVIYNINRSTRVAEKVREVLVGRGVDVEQVTIKGYGESDPVAPNSSAEGMRQNRRIVFKYLKDR